MCVYSTCVHILASRCYSPINMYMYVRMYMYTLYRQVLMHGVYVYVCVCVILTY